jgi:hypothetical protein
MCICRIWSEQGRGVVGEPGRARVFSGTPDYSAPEQVQGRAVDGRTDQYALACVAFQLLAGSVPFERDQGMAVLFAHLSEPPPPLASRRPGLPGSADLVLARAMAKVPENRYGSCREFADALRDAFGLLPYTSPGLAWVPGHPPTEPGAPRAGFSAPVPAVRQAVALESAEVSPGIHSEEPSASAAADAAPAPGGIPVVPAGAAPVPIAVVTEPGPDEAVSAPQAGQEVGLVHDQLAFPPDLVATGPEPEPVTPAYDAAGSAVVADGLAEDLMTYAELAQQGTTDAQAPGPEVSGTELPSLTPGIGRPGAGPTTDSGMEPDAGAAVLAGSAGQNRSLIAGLRHGLGARPLVLAAAAVLIVAVGIGSWLGTGASHGTGTAHRGVAAAASQTAQALTAPVKVRSSPSVTVSNSHPAPTLPTPASSAQTSPAPRPAPTPSRSPSPRPATTYPVSISGATEYSCSFDVPTHYSTGGTAQFAFTNNSSTTINIWWLIDGDYGALDSYVLHPHGGTIVTSTNVGAWFAISLDAPSWPKGCLVNIRVDHNGEATIS